MQTIDDLKEEKFLINIVSLSAQVHIQEKICNLTGGQYHVSIDKYHFEELLNRILVLKHKETSERANVSRFVEIGFPK